MSQLPISNRRTKPHRLFDGLANTLGPVDDTVKARLRAVIDNPTSETWERAYAIMLRPGGTTLWAAVICVDPTFPSRGPGDDSRGRRNPWPRVPDQLTIVRAIRAAAAGRATGRAAIARALRPDRL